MNTSTKYFVEYLPRSALRVRLYVIHNKGIPDMTESNDVNTNSVNKTYLEELAKIDKDLRDQRKAKQLPTLTNTQDSALQFSGISFSCYRCVRFLFANQGARTDLISSQCAVGNVSDTFIGFKKRHTKQLERIGLSVTCENVKAMNRFGKKTTIGTWWLEVADPDKWEEAQKAVAENQQAA